MRDIFRNTIPALLLLTVFFLTNSCIKQDEKNLDEKIGQLLMIGFRGQDLSNEPNLKKMLKQIKPGGIILYDYDVPSKSFERNISSPEQLKSLLSSISEIAETPLFIAIDLEGGKVNRLKEAYGFPRTVSAGYLGEINNPDSTRHYAEQYAKTLKSLGINVNFAPVVDVNTNPNCPIIGKMLRSFSSDPDEVRAHSEIFIDMYSEYEIISALKHFPGHGSSEYDSHHGFTDVSATWNKIELIPYRELISSNKVDMVMTAHVFNEFWDARFPATLSDNVIRSYLRKDLGFDGVVVSDDMCMGAIEQNYSLKNSIELALNADVDLLIFSNNGESYDPKLIYHVFEAIKELLKEGRLTEERIDQSYHRIISLKNKFNLMND